MGKATGSIHLFRVPGGESPRCPMLKALTLWGRRLEAISIQGAGRREPPLPYAEGVDSVGKATGSKYLFRVPGGESPRFPMLKALTLTLVPCPGTG